MSDVGGGVRIPSTGSAPAGPSGTPGQVINPPPSALQLVSGDNLGGTVVGANKQGQLLIKTELGQLTLQTTAKLPVGAQVNLQIRQTGSELYVLIFPSYKKAKDRVARPTAEPTPNPGGPAAPNRTGANSGAALRQDTTSLGQRVSATLQALPPQDGKAGQPLGGVAAAPPGSAGRLGQSSSGALSAYAGPTANAPVLPSGGLSAGAMLTLRILSVLPPPPTGPEPLGGASSLTTPEKLPPPEKLPGNVLRFTGLVIGQNGQGRPLLQSPVGLLVLNLQVNLPVGSRIVLESEPVSAAAARPVDSPPLATGLTAATDGWKSLQDALIILGASTTSHAAQALNGRLPKPDAKLTSSLLFFMAALRTGDLAAWMPSISLAYLKQLGKDDLLQKLGQDFSQLSRLAGEQDLAADWRLFLLPFIDDGQLRQIRLFLRQGGHGSDGHDQDDQGPEATRFVLDVDMSRLGSMQLDGLVRENRFDLVLRSRQQLSPQLRQDIDGIFNNANEIAGFTGSLNFQSSNQWQQMKLPSGAGPNETLLV